MKTVNIDQLKNPKSWENDMFHHLDELSDKIFNRPVGKVDSVTLDIRIPQGTSKNNRYIKNIKDYARNMKDHTGKSVGIRVRVRYVR